MQWELINNNWPVVLLVWTTNQLCHIAYVMCVSLIYSQNCCKQTVINQPTVTSLKAARLYSFKPCVKQINQRLIRMLEQKSLSLIQRSQNLRANGQESNMQGLTQSQVEGIAFLLIVNIRNKLSSTVLRPREETEIFGLLLSLNSDQPLRHILQETKLN